MADKAQVADLANKIRTEKEYTTGALMQLYALQTSEEQDSHNTTQDNGQGFNSQDAGICSSMAQQYRHKNFLSQRQIHFLQQKLGKYANQLLDIDGDVAPLSTDTYIRNEISDAKTVAMFAGILEIRFGFSKELMEKVKSITGRAWKPQNERGKCWIAPPSLMAGTLLKEEGFTFGPKAEEWWEKMNARIGNAALDIPGLKKELYPFQKEGVKFLEAHNGRAIIGDSMGIGKTCQALAYLQYHRDKSALIVVPASLKLNWAREIHMWMDDNTTVEILSGKKPPAWWKRTTDIVIVNYDVLGKPESKDKDNNTIPANGWLPILSGTKFDVLIADESHHIKNSKSARTKCVMALGKTIDHVMCLTGTPIINRPVEMFNSLRLVDSGIFPSFWRYAHRFCGAVHNGFGWDFTGATNTEELHDILTKTCYLRRRKEDVLKELPPKIRTVVPMAMSESSMKMYTSEETKFAGWASGQDWEQPKKGRGAEALVRIENLKQKAIAGKLAGCVEWINDWLEIDGKLVVFCTHQDTVNVLQRAFPEESVTVDGRVAVDKRQAIVDTFQNNKYCKLFIGNIVAAGVGITLHAASNTCFLELGWSPGLHDQAEDRVHRIGQTADSVGAWYLLADGTIEMEIAALLDEKRKVVEMVLDGREAEETSMLTALLDKYRKAKDEKDRKPY